MFAKDYFTKNDRFVLIDIWTRSL